MNDGEDEKVLKISSESFSDFKDKSLDKMEKFEEGESVPHAVSFEDPTKLRKILTEKRIELIQFLMNNEVNSTSELSENLGRGVKEVSKDLNLLEKYGIIKLEKEGRSKKPSTPYNRIEIDIGIETKDQKQQDREKGVA